MQRIKLNYYDTHTNDEILSVVTNDVDAVNTLLGKSTTTRNSAGPCCGAGGLGTCRPDRR